MTGLDTALARQSRIRDFDIDKSWDAIWLTIATPKLLSLTRPGQRGDGYTFYREKYNDILAIVAIHNPDASFA